MAQKLNAAGTRWRVQTRAGEGRPGAIVHCTAGEIAQIEAEYKAKHGRKKLKRSGGLTVEEYLHKWFKATYRGVIEVTTREQYEREVRLINRLIGHLELATLKSDDVLDAYQTAAEGVDGRTHGPDHLKKMHSHLVNALAEAEEEGLILSNPALARRVSKWLRRYRRTRKKPTSPPPPLAEVERLLDSLKTTRSGRRLRGPLLIAEDTGLRRAEVLGLKWQDCDLDLGVMQVQRNLAQTSHHGLIVKSTKTESSQRTVKLTQRTRQFLTDWREEQDALRLTLGKTWTNEDWVFPNTTVLSEVRVMSSPDRQPR